ncbi:DUF2922 domain-containing protein [Clostridium chauvoei]|uniref:DUF2922 domain-containing protein n=2 Tax=Clostridium chauvoei TaxID=46867 RepID=S6FJJ7_9CLOT|nr:DUF2922 domain-containing protein [Clostridium chauvoei]ATD54246.1 hypothetical protein BTM20_02940 [Clostridium chauvoei]ATD58074.1 hypothetical protein BTM21_10140 [Clostridium chauvoei]MBX7279852.1 DUF2922 domain-containing protein [Clostridium chauvoei]MBX7282230.1 DUF2922 domain-containing protein [Clostridium chauvoei]MBX7284742.1 DUF2922 domain-containing protein [Clostridium chauvoei]
MATTTTIVMSFKDPVEKTFKLSVRDVNPEINEDNINALMDNIVANNVIETEYGALASKEKAEVIVKEVTEVNLV